MEILCGVRLRKVGDIVFRRAPKELQDTVDLTRKLGHCDEQRALLLSTCRNLLYILKTFSFDIAEIDSSEFKQRVDATVDLLAEESNLESMSKSIDGNKDYFLKFADREKAYFSDKDQEFQNIIELLRTSLIEIMGENQDLNGRMTESGAKMEQLTCLNDIRQIKEGLKTEIDQVRQILRNKQGNDLKRMDSLSQQVGALKTSLEKVRKISMTDSLTGLENRMSFDDYVRDRLERHTLSNAPFSLLMCDIDDFKKINDTYGHQVGDCILRVFAEVCKATAGPGEFIARYGGEEFVVVLPQRTLKTALRRAQQLCVAVSKNEHQVNLPPVCGILRFCLSIGVAEATRDDTVENLITRADQALYAAKRSGKNRAVSQMDAEKVLARVKLAA